MTTVRATATGKFGWDSPVDVVKRSEPYSGFFLSKSGRLRQLGREKTQRM